MNIPTDDTGSLKALADDLLSLARKDPTSMLAPDNVAQLAKIMAERPDIYEGMRNKLKAIDGIRVTELDRAISKLAHVEHDDLQGTTLSIDPPDPWHETVDGAALLDDIVKIIRRHVVLPEHYAEIVAPWCLYTHCVDAFRISPRLAILAPEKGSGKSTLLSVIQLLVRKPLSAANITAPAVFRAIEAVKPTLLIDEADTFINDSEELRGVLDSGHDRPNAFVVRTAGNDHEVRKFATFGAVAFGAIGKLPATLMDRSIVISMQRKLNTDTVERFRSDRVEEFEPLRRKAARWAMDNLDQLREADPDIPDSFGNRTADNWRILLAIADKVEGNWPQTVRSAALATHKPDDTQSLGEMLLEDMRYIFNNLSAEVLPTQEILSELQLMHERPWPVYRYGGPINARQLADLLSPYGIKSFSKRSGSQNLRHYSRSSFEDTFQRYLPRTGQQSVTPYRTP